MGMDPEAYFNIDILCSQYASFIDKNIVRKLAFSYNKS